MTDNRVAGADATAHLLDAERKFAIPATLKEQMYVIPGHAKPLCLLHLLYTLSLRRVLCFTKSVEAASRLVQLLSFFADEYASGAIPRVEAANYSSDLSPAKRKEVVERFTKGDVGVLVCSDLVARGMDIAGVEHVVNYDAPIDMRKYVHRVGRTARAGKEGQAWSLVEKQEVSSSCNSLEQRLMSVCRPTRSKACSKRQAITKLFGSSRSRGVKRSLSTMPTRFVYLLLGWVGVQRS